MTFAPHLLIRASAGSGKTFQLTTRYLSLLARGASPERILATTFTRKAAGEIQGRVLLRLASAVLDPTAAAQLGEAMELPAFGQPEARALLVETVRKLGRMRIATFDSFFGSLARVYAYELGLPPRAVIVPDDLDDRLRERAMGRMLTAMGTDAAVELLRLLARGRLDQSVSRKLLDLLRGLGDVFLESPESAWKKGLPASAPPATFQEQAAVFAATLDGLRDGGARLTAVIDKDRAALHAHDLAALAGSAFVRAVQADEPTYYKKPLPEPLVQVYRDLAEVVAAELAHRLAESTAALWDFLAAFDAHYRAVKQEAAALRFEDIPRALARGGVDAATGEGFSLDDLALRLDGRLDHLLFDEFQDTSLAQWMLLETLVDEVRSSFDGSRSLLVVGDRKQAIYGFRGGVAGIFDALGDADRPLTIAALDRSFRSSPVVIDFVNQLFEPLATNPALAAHPRAVAEFAGDFRPHEAARAGLAGYVELSVSPLPSEPRAAAIATATLRAGCDRVVDILAGHRATDGSVAPGAPTVGILVRTNRAVRRIMHELRRRGIEASEEGGNSLADAPVVAAVLALCTLADHPGDTVAQFHVATSPLGATLDPPLSFAASSAEVGRLARGLRRRFLSDGYGETLRLLVERLLPELTPHEEERLSALLEIAYAYEPFATLRPRDFVAHVRRKKVEDPRAAPVRVMTVHQSKGLEFDAVVLCELETALVPTNRSPVLVSRRSALAPIERVSRAAPKDERALLPELAAMADDADNREMVQSLALLYVAVTRPVHALYAIVAPVGDREKKGPAKTFAAVLRHGLASNDEAAPGAVLFARGDPGWARPRR
jgi:ATP-dependent helicase/nuclease subunit A